MANMITKGSYNLICDHLIIIEVGYWLVHPGVTSHYLPSPAMTHQCDLAQVMPSAK